MSHRPVRHRPGFLVEVFMFRIADNADDFIRLRPTGEALTQRVFIREILPGQRFIYNDDVAILADLLFGEETAAFERDLQRAKEVLISDTNARSVRRGARSRLWTAFYAETVLRSQSEEWRMVDGARRFDAGQSSDSFEGLREEVDDLGVLIVAGARQRDAHRQHVPRVEAHVHALQPHEAAREQSRARE